jgi:small subunit ribosomal protein S14
VAKTSSVEKNNKKQKLIKKYQQVRSALRAIIRDPNASVEEKFRAQEKMQKLPRGSNACQYRNRCFMTGRPRGVYRRFGVGRNKLRELVMSGLVPGIRKASW